MPKFQLFVLDMEGPGHRVYDGLPLEYLDALSKMGHGVYPIVGEVNRHNGLPRQILVGCGLSDLRQTTSDVMEACRHGIHYKPAEPLTVFDGSDGKGGHISN
jgi:hypothetical protein